MIPLRAVIADDERLMREQLRARLAEVWPELQIVAEARNGLEAVALVEQHRPDLVFLDIRMPGLSGVDAARQIAQMNAVAAGYAARFETPGAMPPSDLTPIQRSSLPAGNERIASSYGAIGGGSSGAANVAFKINGASMDVFINGKEWLSSAG